MGNRNSSSSGGQSGGGQSGGQSGGGLGGGYPAEYQYRLRGAASGRLSSSSSSATAEASGRSGSRSTRGSSSSSQLGGGRSQDQTTCPECQRVLLVPANAPLFRCPCGVLFRTESLLQRRGMGGAVRRVGVGPGGGAVLMGSGGSSLSSLLLGMGAAGGGNGTGVGSVNRQQRAVLCRRCRRLSLVRASLSPDEVVICRCGAPALPLNDMVMSLLAEGGESTFEARRGPLEG